MSEATRIVLGSVIFLLCAALLGSWGLMLFQSKETVAAVVAFTGFLASCQRACAGVWDLHKLAIKIGEQND